MDDDLRKALIKEFEKDIEELSFNFVYYSSPEDQKIIASEKRCT